MQKLDPKSKWLFFIRYISIAFVFALFFSSLIGSIANAMGGLGLGLGVGFLVFAVTVGITYLAAHLSYINYSYQLDEHVFKKEFGVIMRRSTSIPYERIQNVDIVRGLLSRILGLADLNIQTAGGSAYGLTSEGRLPGVSKEEALKIQAELLAKARGATQAPVAQYQTQTLVAQPAQQPPVAPVQPPVGEQPQQPAVENKPQDTSGL